MLQERAKLLEKLPSQDCTVYSPVNFRLCKDLEAKIRKKIKYSLKISNNTIIRFIKTTASMLSET